MNHLSVRFSSRMGTRLEISGANSYYAAMTEELLPLIDMALQEDLGSKGEVTSKAIVADGICTALLKSKDSGILAG